MPHPLDPCGLCGHDFKDHDKVCWGVNPPDDGCCGCPGFEERPMAQKFNREAYEALLTYEVTYLEANGWKKVGLDSWSNEALLRDDLRHGHAVNVQKQRDRMSL